MTTETKRLLFRLSSMPVNKGHDWLDLSFVGARLAALGHRDCLLRAIETQKRLNLDSEKLLAVACRIGRSRLWEMRLAGGVYLAREIIRANDACCWLTMTEEIDELKPLATPMIESEMGKWFEAANSAHYDYNVLKHLQRFKQAYPLPNKYCLATVFQSDASIKTRTEHIIQEDCITV